MNGKKTLLIVGYYCLEDGFRACANFLSKDYNILFFPLLYYHNDNMNVVDDLTKYINGEKIESKKIYLNSYGKRPDIVFLWFYNYFALDYLKIDQFMQIKKNVSPNVKFIGYNWDPFPPKEEMNFEKLYLISMLDSFITGDSTEINYLKKQGFKNIEYGPSGFDPLISRYVRDDNYKCDVSIVCTNLYTDNNWFPEEYVRLNRKKLVDIIYKHRNEMKFHIYGPQFLSELYPDCYRGYVKYVDCPRVFSNSKVNLCIHAVSYNSNDIELYFSERLPQILGSQGLLYCETEYSYLLEPNVNYILADPEDPVGQIKDIIRNYEHYKYQKIIKNGYSLAVRHFTWDVLRQKLSKILGSEKRNYNENFIYNII